MTTNIKQVLLLAGAILLMLPLGISCDKKKASKNTDDPETVEYADRLEEQAQEINKKCPKQMANGMELMSVTFEDNTQLYRYRVTDQQIITIDLEQARDSIIASLTENEKEYLINGKCCQEHRYVSPNDSSSITIIPSELEQDDDE